MGVKVVLIRYLNKIYISYYLVSEILLKCLLMGEIWVMHSITIPLFNLSNKLENSAILINYHYCPVKQNSPPFLAEG